MPANGNGQHLDAEDIAGAACNEQNEIKLRQQASGRRRERAVTGSGPVFYCSGPFISALPQAPADTAASALSGHIEVCFGMPTLA